MAGGCKARREADEMYCAQCHLRWDINDPVPPPCSRDKIRPEQWEALKESILNGEKD